jgi:hypothetical protein
MVIVYHCWREVQRDPHTRVCRYNGEEEEASVTDAADDDDSSASSTYSCGGSDSDVECNP